MVANHFIYLSSTFASNLSLYAKITKHINKATSAVAKLSERVWGNTQLRVNTKLKVYQMYLLCTLLYCSESLTTYARQENCLENFHLCCIYQILSIIWQNKMEEKIAGESSFPQHALYALSMLSAFSWTCAPYG